MTAISPQATYTPDASILANHNDQFRRHKCLGMPKTIQLTGLIVMTQSLSALDPMFIMRARIAIGHLDVFEPDNDPERFHDFGSVEIEGQKVWFKIDLFEAGSGKRYGAETPDNPATTERVMTLMLPSDW